MRPVGGTQRDEMGCAQFNRAASRAFIAPLKADSAHAVHNQLMRLYFPQSITRSMPDAIPGELIYLEAQSVLYVVESVVEI